MHHNTTLFATLRFKRKPVSNDIVCFKLRVAHALPVHKHVLHECDITTLASMQQVNATLAQLAAQHKCGKVELDARRDVLRCLEGNS